MFRKWISAAAFAGMAGLCLILSAPSGYAQVRQGSPSSAKPSVSSESHSALIAQYCSGCHNDKVKSGGMTLTSLDVVHPERTAELAEKVIRKLNAGLMPPAGARRPDADAVKELAGFLEAQIDKAAANKPAPGRRPFQRLTRTEYARTIHDLLDIDEDVSGLLPPDSLSAGFDNIADSQAFSPALMEGYIRAAAKISRDALGDPNADATSVTFKIPRTSNQLRHVDGAPLGTRGGISIVHNFPADGNYSFRVLFYDSPEGQLFGRVYPGEQIEISINGERVALLDIPLDLSENGPVGLTIQTPPIAVKGGPQRVSAAFIQRTSLLVDDLIAPIEYTLADATIGNLPEITTLSHLKDFEILGPIKVTGISDSPSRRRIFKCRPLTAAEELPCATKIISELAREAYRRPISAEDLEGLLTFYESGRKSGDFESGIRLSLEALLASPNFVFRFEKTPNNLKPGQAYRVDDLELASRLSYFLWSTAPDDELIGLASQSKLKDPAVLEKQVRRMLSDPRSEALSTKFAAEWFHLADLANMQTDPVLYPQFDHTLAEAMRRETELFFDSIVHEDRNILDLLTANYTFVNERLAMHYSVPDILGSRFRRVEIQDPNRRGLLGQGSILVLTSHADRTSPVLRGKWVMDVLLGTPPPPPPPNVPELGQTKSVENGKQLSVRERMEIHRASASCSSCHRMIDPIGLALENFDPTGLWRLHDNDSPVDATTQLWDGTKVDGPAGLRQAILNHSNAFIDNFTERLTTYALGRRVDYRDMPLIRSIAREAERNNNRFSSFVLGIIKSPAFQMSTAEGTQ